MRSMRRHGPSARLFLARPGPMSTPARHLHRQSVTGAKPRLRYATEAVGRPCSHCKSPRPISGAPDDAAVGRLAHWSRHVFVDGGVGGRGDDRRDRDGRWRGQGWRTCPRPGDSRRPPRSAGGCARGMHRRIEARASCRDGRGRSRPTS